MSDTELKQQKWPEVYGGGGLGLLVGVLLGLSATEVVGGVITALMALLATYLGLKSQSGEEGAKTSVVASANQAIRLGSFALVCVVGIFVGLFVRTHNLTGRSIPNQVQQLRDAGFPDSTARSLIAFREFGVKPGGVEITDDAKTKSKLASSVLFADFSKDNCGKLKPSSFVNLEDLIHAWQIEDEVSKVVADSIVAKIPEDGQREAFQSYWEAKCK